MKTWERYAWLSLIVLIIIFLYSGSYFELEATSEPESIWSFEALLNTTQPEFGDSECRMSTCFNFSRCVDRDLKVYVYPTLEDETFSVVYSKILTSIKESVYYTSNPEEACLFVLAIDTIDRDKISENYVRDVDGLIATLPKELWNEGINHVIFNLYHGTFPDYADHNLGFNTGRAIVARASPSVQNFRFGFDLSFPLFHKEHNLRAPIERQYDLKVKDRHLVSFKGKRYVYGIGSETRDALHHLHNDESVVMVTTCKHNNDWKEHQDDRCARDNEEYDKWDYEGMMVNSTFCLTPRGRRLGSFRFLESLRLACIPVVLSDDWVLPFAEVVDWSTATVVVPEENVLLVPSILYDFTPEEILRMKEACRHLYNTYFRDVESITLTSLEIIFDRIRRSETLPTRINSDLIELNCEQQRRMSRFIIKANNTPSGRLQKIVDILKLFQGEKEVIVIWPKARGVRPTGADLGVQFPVRFSSDTEFFPYSKDFGLCDSFIFIDDRTEFDLSDVQTIARYVNLHMTRAIGMHGIEYEPMTGSLAFATSYNAMFPSIIGFSGLLLESSMNYFPAELLSKCPFTALNIRSAQISLQAPVLIRKKPIQKWMKLGELLQCWKEVSSRWTPVAPLFYSDLVYV